MANTPGYYLHRFIITCVLLMGCQYSFATHIVAADMQYRWVSGNTYKITVTLFGDCGAASAFAFAGLPVSRPEVCIYYGTTLLTTLSLKIEQPACGEEITPVLCPGTITQCSDPSSTVPGIKRFVYSDTVTLPGVSHIWRFVYDGSGGNLKRVPPCNGTLESADPPISGRGANITNISDVSRSIIQLIDTLDNVDGPNSSPLFNELPTPFFCVNANNCYVPRAHDLYDSTGAQPLGDSLTFALIPGTVGQTTCGDVGGEVDYIGIAWHYPDTQAITGSTPLQVDSASQFYFDPATGGICFFPSVVATGRCGVQCSRVQEWKNDRVVPAGNDLWCAGVPEWSSICSI